VPPLEAWEKVILNQEAYFETMHGRFGCVTCHGGVGGTDDKDEAHEGMVREPASAEACATCHPDEAAGDAHSLHTTLAGYTTVLAARSTAENMPQLKVAMENHCNRCHTTCGQCHVSRPTNLGGGLVASHEFKTIPPMNLTCTGCHGSRIQDEYKGNNAGVPGDTHWIQEGMPCFDCHTADEMHGTLGEHEHRYDDAPTPSCSDTGLEVECHAVMALAPEIEQHDETHLEAMSCETCHSVTYKNCYGCHVGLQDGVAYFKTEPSQMTLKIGLNPIQSAERPWKYVLVRHVPIARDSFQYYGEDLLPNFDVLPTWKYATPHNSQLVTPQNKSCNACHGNAEYYLTAKDVLPDELEANRGVIVPEIPETVEGEE
jgi:hypothetical protein